MRSATKTFVSMAGLGVLIASARLGLPVANAAATVATPTPTETAATDTATTTKTPTATKTPTPTTTAKPAATSGAKTSSAVGYRFGVVQVKVTKTSGKITSVDLVQGTATNGREAAFPSLIQATLDANGANFGNLSGATYTTNAFKKAVKSALAKF